MGTEEIIKVVCDECGKSVSAHMTISGKIFCGECFTNGKANQLPGINISGSIKFSDKKKER